MTITFCVCCLYMCLPLQERVVVKEPPSAYLSKLRQLIDPKLLSGKSKSLTIGSKVRSMDGVRQTHG